MRNLTLFFLILLTACSSKTNKESKENVGQVEIEESIDYEKEFQKKISENNKEVSKKLEIETEIKRLREEGVIGLWQCDFTGYESEIKIYEKGKKYYAEIDFTKSKMKTKTERLKLVSNKYFVEKSKVKEYYFIKKDGNLELGDDKGLFTTAINIMPGAERIELPEFNPTKVIGEDIFTVIGNYSKSPPQTLDGTNNKFWIVYYEDLNTEFKVIKRSNVIVAAKIKE